jgi:hypothetical protein
VALNAPGKYDSGSAPILFANTTAKAEFCIPVSMDIVLDVLSVKPNSFFGTKYPAVNPSVCVKMTERRIKLGRDNAKPPMTNPAALLALPVTIAAL